MYTLTEEHLTEDDRKVLKHLKSIDNLFKKGNLTIYQLFVNNGHLIATKLEDDKEYEIDAFDYIICDGGEPDGYGEFGIYGSDELEEYYENN